jgi:hypothetical protein
MKKLLLAGVAVVALVAPAHAQFFPFVVRPYVPYYHHETPSKWHAYQSYIGRDSEDAGAPTCVMETKWANGLLKIQYVHGEKGLEIQISKHGWRFPDNQKVHLSITFDNDLFGVPDGRTWTFRHEHLVSVWVASNDTARFLEAFAAADTMYLEFQEGDEGTWHADMTGSRDAKNRFENCVSNIMVRYGPPTQPTGNGEQPVGDDDRVLGPEKNDMAKITGLPKEDAWPKWLPLKGDGQ